VGKHWLSAAVVAITATNGAHGHHSLAGVYDSAKQLTVSGVVAEFQFVNPHPILVIDVAADGGEPQLWRLEMDNRFELVSIGMSVTTLQPGERVSATGSAHRSEPQRLYLRRLDRPADGFYYEQIGSSPRTNPPLR